MGVHFLLSGAARAAAMSEEDAHRWFRRARWPDKGGRVPWCAHCGAEGARTKSRRRFLCLQKECRREFTVTSGTVLAHHKLPLRKLVLLPALFTQSVKGQSALRLSRELDVGHKAAYVLEADASTNQAEGVFDRMRRGAPASTTGISGRYLDWHASEWA